MGQGVFLITEQRDGVFRKVSYEAASEGRRLADALNTDLTAVVLGSGVENIAGELDKYGADKILVADDPALSEYTTDAYANVLSEIIKSRDPALVIMGASINGKDLAPRLAARLGTGLAIDCTAIKVEDGELLFTRPMFGGKVLADVKIEATPQIVAIRPNVMSITETPKTAAVEKTRRSRWRNENNRN